MKKTYINPQLQVIVIETAGMLAQSLRKGDGYIDPGDMGAPEFDWDEDEFEEY